MNRSLLVRLAPLALAGCGAAQVNGTNATSAGKELAPAAAPDVEIRDASGAVVAGKAVGMDGVAEGLAWPGLRAALARKPGDHTALTVAVARGVPLGLVLRAVWTLRDADLRLQTADASGAVHVLELRPKPDVPPAADATECHLAVFVAPSGDVRVATPGGPHVISGAKAADGLAAALAAESPGCPIRYVGFGAENADAAWSQVFDVARAVDRDKSAGDARYVLAEPVHQAGR
jgi:hypothetical protein